MKQWKVAKDESGLELKSFLKEKMPEFSLRSLKKGIESNLCRINGRTERFASSLVGAGDIVEFAAEKLDEAKQRPVVTCADILFQDTDLMIINKPAGIASDAPELKKQLAAYSPSLELVHRLDRDTSGILIFAANPHAKKELENRFKERKIKKSYLAIADGTFTKKKGRIHSFLAKKHAYEGQALWGSQKSGLSAETEWEIEQEGKNAALVLCHPITGRTHQIRVHLSEMGHPILGDYQYGREFKCAYRPSRCLLHAWKIALDHPATEKKIEIEAPLPQDFQQAKAALMGPV